MPEKENMWKSNYVYQKKWHGFGLAFILLAVGLFWLLKDIGVIKSSISVWPILLIAVGLYWVIAAIIKNIFW